MSDYLYVVMCGGDYHTPEPKQFREINGERIVDRTIRLLRENGVSDIAVSINHYEDRFDYLSDQGVVLLHKVNNFGRGGRWLEGFFRTEVPTCYIFGDVVFSPEAIKKIVETPVDNIQFFASAPPFDKRYIKHWAEPFAFKVNDVARFQERINRTIELADGGAFYRDPIAWELWQVIKETPLKQIDYRNYVAINDYTCDVDCDEDYEKIKRMIP